MLTKKSIIIGTLLMMSLLFLGSGTQVHAATQGDILISEVLYDTPGTDSVEEFVELYNPGSSAIDLSGWYLQDNSGTFSLSGSIDAGSFLLVARDTAGFNALFGFNPDISGMTLALGNSGDKVDLYDTSSNLIDRVAWEGEIAGWTLSASHTSLERIDSTPVNEASWQDSGVTGNPGTSDFLSSGSDYPLIFEVVYDGSGLEADSEYVELFNPTSSAIDLTGYTLHDNFASFSLSGTIAAGEYFVVADNGAGFQSTYGVSADQTGSTLALSNSGDQVSLTDPSGTEVDFMAYENYVSGWSISASTGESLTRTSSSDTDTVDDWSVLATPTPGSGDGSSGGGGDPDTTAPTIAITNPTDGETLGGTVTITTSSSDDVGVTVVDIYIDGTLASTGSSYAWDTTTVADGSHTIQATAYDEAGNSASDSIAVTVDNANYNPPAVGQVKIMEYNVEQSGANADWKEVVKEENPDIAIFIETGNWDDNNNAQLNALCDEFNTYFTGLGEDPYYCTGTEGVPYSTSGEAVFSRHPILSSTQIPLVTLDDGTSYDVSHDFLDVEIDIGGSVTHVVASHLKCCGGATNEEKREFQQEGIINYMDDLGDVPIIYSGDLNSFSPEDTDNLGDLNYGPMSMQLKDDTYGSYSSRGSTVHTWDDPLTTLYPGQFFPTYGHQNAQYTSRIDFITVNQHFSAANYIDATVGDTATADTGSDHYSTDLIYDFGDGGAGESDTTAPSQVTGLTATVVSTSQIDLTWDAATDDTGVDHYNIYRDGVQVATSASTSYSDTGLSPSTTYTYEISAVDAAGNEGTLSASVSETTQTSSTTGMYVQSITLGKINIHSKNGKFDVLVEIVIVDEAGNPVEGASVSIDFTVPRGDVTQYTATTDANGKASFVITPPGHSSSGTFTATVVDVTATGFNYDVTLNVETSDSATLV